MQQIRRSKPAQEKFVQVNAVMFSMRYFRQQGRTQAGSTQKTSASQGGEGTCSNAPKVANHTCQAETGEEPGRCRWIRRAGHSEKMATEQSGDRGEENGGEGREELLASASECGWSPTEREAQQTSQHRQ